MNSARRSAAHARLQALDAAVAHYFATASPAFERIHERINRGIGDVRSLLNVRSETEDYLVPLAVMFLDAAEGESARAKALMQKDGTGSAPRGDAGDGEPQPCKSLSAVSITSERDGLG